MAGVSFFLTLVFCLIFLKTWDVNMIGVNLIGAMALMFAVGLKDDLVITSPRAKIGSEIIAIFFVLFCNCVQVYSLEGFLGIQSIPPIVSYTLIVLMILTIINSYNLIDGIDGLASTLGIVFLVFMDLFSLIRVYISIFYFAYV